MTTEAGKAPDAAAAGNAAAATVPPAGEAVKAPSIPTEVMPLVEKLFDERLAKVLPAKQQEWEAAQKNAQKQAEMSELEKANARAATLESQLSVATANYTRESRVRELVGKAIPSLMAEGIVNRLGDGYTPEKAIEMATAELAPLTAGKAAPPATFPGAGGQSSGTGNDALSDAELQAQVKSGAMKIDEFNRVMDARRFAKAGIT